jgi:hypothetical protein
VKPHVKSANKYQDIEFDVSTISSRFCRITRSSALPSFG